jgi:hypothetical protein
VLNLENQTPDLEAIAKSLKRKPKIDQNPFSKLPNEALKEALKLLYEVSEEIDPKL